MDLKFRLMLSVCRITRLSLMEKSTGWQNPCAKPLPTYSHESDLISQFKKYNPFSLIATSKLINHWTIVGWVPVPWEQRYLKICIHCYSTIILMPQPAKPIYSLLKHKNRTAYLIFKKHTELLINFAINEMKSLELCS